MQKIVLSFLFLIIVYVVKAIIDYNRLYRDLDCHNPGEKFKHVLATNFYAILLSYLFCLVGAYEERIEELQYGDTFIMLISCFGFLTAVTLVSIQNKESYGIANSISDMSGSIFFIATVTKPTIYLMFYISVFILMLLFYILKCEREDNGILHIVVTIGVDAVLILPSMISDRVVSWLSNFGFTDKMLYYSIVMLLSETIIPLVSNQLIALFFGKLKTVE